MSIGGFFPHTPKKAEIFPARFRDDAGVRALSAFYLNPVSWTEVKRANWVKHDIPGLSDPIQQWTSSGARTVTFEALVSLDFQKAEVVKQQEKSVACSAFGELLTVAKVAQQVLNIPDLTSQEIINRSQSNRPKHELDITEKLNYYRSLTYPNQFGRGKRTKAPDPVILDVGKVFGLRTRNALFVVDKVDINITKMQSVLTDGEAGYQPELRPIEARVNFTLTELVNNVLSADTHIRNDANPGR